VGLVGNAFVVFVIVRMTSLHKQVANVFVINQSIIDAASSVLVIAQMVVEYDNLWLTLTDGQPASVAYCALWQGQALMWGLFTSSTYNLVALTIERYMKVSISENKHNCKHKLNRDQL
jgi:hypothetical protein